MLRARIAPIAFMLALAATASRAQDQPRPDGWVVIPAEEYRALRARAFPPDQPQEPPPVDAALTRITYDLTLAGETVTGTATAIVDVMKAGWVRVLIPDGLLVRDAQVDGRPVSLVDQPSRHVLLSKTGRSTLVLRIVLPVTAAGGTESVVVPPAPAGVVEASLLVPRSGVDLTVTNGFLTDSRDSDGQSRWTVHGHGNEPLTFSWRRRVEDHRAQQPLRFRGSVTELVGLGEDSTQITASVRIEVLQGLAPIVTLALPPQVTISQVSGPLVADWDAGSSGTLTVAFHDPLASSTAFTVTGEVRGPKDGVVAVPLMRLPQAERETGGVAVDVLGAGEITDRQPTGFEPADALDLGEIVAGRESPSLVAFRAKPIPGSESRSLTVRVSRYATQASLIANIDEARYQVLVVEDGKSLVRARYAVRNNQRGLLSVALPPDATLWSTVVAGRPVRPGRSNTGALLIPLEKARSRNDLPAFVVELLYVSRIPSWADKGRSEVTLPAVDLPISRTGLVLHHSPRFRVVPTPATFHVEPYADAFSGVLRDDDRRPIDVAAASADEAADSRDKDAVMKELVRQYQRADGGRGVPGIVPIDIPFPEFGPMVFLAAELTPETKAAVVGLEYERVKSN